MSAYAVLSDYCLHMQSIVLGGKLVLSKSIPRPIELGRRSKICAMTGQRSSHSADGSVKDQIIQLLEKHKDNLPKCIVLDLDYTVWPFWCEVFTVHDSPRLYPDVESIIDACRQQGILLAVASRTPTPDVATAFLRKSGLNAKFDNIQLIPARDGFDTHSSQKDVCHLPAIKAATGLEWSDMLFFDDEKPNVVKVQRLGVCSVLVSTRTGLCRNSFQQGLEQYAAQDS